MSGITRDEEYLSLIESFLSGNLEVISFCYELTALWTLDRDEMYAKKATWSQPYDEMLTAAYLRGEISKNDFSQKHAELWGYSEDSEFRTKVHTLHSACSVFSPSPELEGEISEEELRQEVREALAAYQRRNEPLARTA